MGLKSCCGKLPAPHWLLTSRFWRLWSEARKSTLCSFNHVDPRNPHKVTGCLFALRMLVLIAWRSFLHAPDVLSVHFGKSPHRASLSLFTLIFRAYIHFQWPLSVMKYDMKKKYMKISTEFEFRLGESTRSHQPLILRPCLINGYLRNTGHIYTVVIRAEWPTLYSGTRRLDSMQLQRPSRRKRAPRQRPA